MWYQRRVWVSFCRRPTVFWPLSPSAASSSSATGTSGRHWKNSHSVWAYCMLVRIISGSMALMIFTLFFAYIILIVEFVGWISTHEKLALQLLSLDIVINTSLRAWSEVR